MSTTVNSGSVNSGCVNSSSVVNEGYTRGDRTPEFTTRGPVTRSAANRRRREPPPPAGPWILITTNTSGDGASKSFVQEKVGEWLGMLTVVPLIDRPVLSEEQCTLITIALEHKALFRDYPITNPELVRIATELWQNQSSTSQLAGGADEEPCKCVVHTSEIEPTLLAVLRNIMSCSSELGGRFLSGNLTNIAMHLLTYIIKTIADLGNVQIQPEIKSAAQNAGSKVVINFGCGEQHLTVESTPDFYIRKQSPIVYLTIGEVESVNSEKIPRCS